MIQLDTQTRLRPIIRLFVSSTFSDMKHERNALQADVFPKLEKLCMENGFQFQAIDLRWGVSSEAGLDHRTMRICFEELKRAQEISPEPNFLILLGDKYGWRPLPEEISQSEFNRLLSFAKGNSKEHPEIPGVHQKSSCQILEEWYRCDENILISESQNNDADSETLNYILQPRTQNLGDGRNYERRKDDPTKDSQDWLDVQKVLWNIINAAYPSAELSGRFERDWQQHLADVNDEIHPKRAVPQIVRFQASATEQEIWSGALSAFNAEKHVIACYREITNRGDFTNAELRDFYNLTESGELDSFSSRYQSDLKAAIQKRLGDSVPIQIPFNRLRREHDTLAIEANETSTRKFCKDVFNRIKPIIERQFEEYWDKSKPSSSERAIRELNIERNEHKRFGKDRSGEKSFVGRKSELQTIHDYLNGNSRWPMVIHGTSGSGKTALLARAFEKIPEDQKPIIRFIGTTPYSSDIRSLLLSLCQELRERFPRVDILPSDVRELQKELQDQLQLNNSSEQPLILFLDGLDQLSDTDNGRSLSWIPYGQLPPNVKLVLSCLSDRNEDDPASQPYNVLSKLHLPQENIINLDVLTEDEAKVLLFNNWLPKFGRKLNNLQQECVEKILESKECCQPIYLKLLFEEIRLWRSYDSLPEIGKNLPALLKQLFDRLSLETNHGQLLVERVLGYLSASRYGLAENEILEILFLDPEYKAKLDNINLKNHHELPTGATRIPIAIWSRLRYDLASYLTERAAPGANVLTFFHRQVGEWVRDHYRLAGQYSLKAQESPVQKSHAHARLAEYFTACAKGTDPQKEWETDSIRGFSECVFHHILANHHKQATSLLTKFIFLLQKLRLGLLESAFEDYKLIQIRCDNPMHRSKNLNIWLTFFHEKAYILRCGKQEWPVYKIFFQLAIEHADDSPITNQAEMYVSKNGCEWPRYQQVNRPTKYLSNKNLIRFEGHRGILGGWKILENRTLLSWGHNDSSIRLWEISSGECKLTLFHAEPIDDEFGHFNIDKLKGVWRIDHKYLISWSSRNIKLWDLEFYICIKSVDIPPEGTIERLNLWDGRVISWSSDIYKIYIQDLSENIILNTYQQYLYNGECSNTQWVFNQGIDHTITQENTLTGEIVQKYIGHQGSIDGYQSNHNRILMTYSSDDTSIRIWNMKDGKCLATLLTHEAFIKEVSILEDGKILFWFDFGTLYIWNGKKCSFKDVEIGHGREVLQLFPLDSGLVVSVGHDYIIRLWNWQTGKFITQINSRGIVTQLNGAWLINKDQLLTWTTWHLQLWDLNRGVLIENIDETSAIDEWLDIRANASYYWRFCQNFEFFIGIPYLDNFFVIRWKGIKSIVFWYCDYHPLTGSILPDGTAIIGLNNGTLRFLKLFKGKTRMSLKELIQDSNL